MIPLVTLAIQELPTILDFLRGLHAQANPGAPDPTDEEMIAALHAAVQSSLAKDEAWLAAHPSPMT